MTVIKLGPASYNFFDTSTSEFLTSALLNIESLNSLLSNINDDGDNNEKIKNLKTWVGIFKNIGGNIPGGSFLGGSFPGGIFRGVGL